VTVSVKGKQSDFEILGSVESNPFKGRISYSSPLGAALIGHSPGESVQVKIQNTEVTYDIVSID
jgi:transcription elongation factor GreA